MNFPDEQQISDYLERVRASGALGKSNRRLFLLEHLIRAEAEGSGGQLKAYSIGLDIFGKGPDFDPQSDSVVRVEIGRLRTAIAVFESSEFADCDLQVEIPKGTYRPTLTKRTIDARQTESMERDDAPARPAPFKPWKLIAAAVFMAVCVGLAVFGLGWFVTPQGDSRIAVQLDDFSGASGPETATILRRGLSNNKALSVLLAPQNGDIHPDAAFVVRGSVQVDPGETQVDIELINAETDAISWSKTIHIDDRRDFDTAISERIGRELRVRLFGASKELLEGRDPETLTPEQLFVMGTWVPGPAINAVEWELERVQLMEIALRKDPDFGAAHSVVADKLAYLANVYGPSNTPELLTKARWHAQRAMELAPLDANVVFNVAQSQWHSGSIAQSLATMKRVTELDPNHALARFLARMIPYSCAAAPDSVVEQAIAFDNALSADNPIRWLTLTWIAWLHAYRGDFTLALEAEQRAALIFEIPYTFMRHAMLLNKLGRPEQAAAVIERQKSNWPDIDPAHFSSVTIPRLCSEQPDSTRFIELYSELETALLNQ
ncbi:hypothetical protein ABVF61_25520 [Roseibium sp. HPY-6]|uniref:hypothetical protein n=1 Tax=Roseibium sp. HPY-6 TaxID=3229852 RepID=UPI00338DB382